jgi:exonuclease SbcD
MAGESFRFIHASDFHLEAPLGDLDTLPAQLREAIAAAPMKAAQAIFDAALVENIDFLVLSGDLLNPTTAGPRGMSLLLNNFDKLHQKKTPVFWAAAGADDPARWPEAAPLPPNVTLFPKNRTVSIPVQRAGRTICQVIGRSSEGRSQLHVPSYRVDPTDEFTVAIGAGSADADSLAEGRFDYWALGGEHQRTVITSGTDVGALYCGSPQGRSLDEPGAHGYTIVDVDADKNIRTQNVDCDSFRYFNIELDAGEFTTANDVRAVLGNRIARMLHDNGSRHLIIGWDIAVSSDSIQVVGDPAELLSWLRRDFGHGAPSAWTARLRVRPPKKYPKNWCEEDTILGDYLRAADRHLKSGGRDLNLAPFTEEYAGLSKSLASMLADAQPGIRGELLEEATLIGVECLRGGKPTFAGASEER